EEKPWPLSHSIAFPISRWSSLSTSPSNMFFHVALHRRLSYAGREPVKSAFYVTDPQAAHLVRIHALMTDQSPLNVEMFEELEAAAKCLGVPVKSLMARASGTAP